MDPDRALGLAASPEQRAEREVQLDRLRLDAHHLDERVDRLVVLLVEQEVQALEVGVGEGFGRARGEAALAAGSGPA